MERIRGVAVAVLPALESLMHLPSAMPGVPAAMPSFDLAERSRESA